MKACEQSKCSERLYTKQFHYFRTVFVKQDRETGKVAQKPCSFTRQSRSVQLDSRAIKSRTRATKSRDKIARVTSV